MRPTRRLSRALPAFVVALSFVGACGTDDDGRPADRLDAEGGVDALPDAAGGDAGRDVGTPDASGEVGEVGEVGGPGDVAGDVGDGMSVFAASICPAQAAWQCGMQTACGCPGAEDAAGCVPDATASCLSRVAAAMQNSPSPLQVDAARVDGCVAAWSLAVIDCGAPGWERLDAACGPVLVAAVGVGASCDAEGLPCASGAGTCVGGACLALPGALEACAVLPDFEGPPLCRPGLLCVGGTCLESPRALGETCDMDGHCEVAARCVDGRCAPTAGAGEACDEATACRGATSCVEGRCVAGTPDACSAPGETGDCGVESLCGAPRQMTCAPLAEVGEACETTEACVAGAYCDPEAKRCAAAPGDGLPCADGWVCAPGLACSFDTFLCGAIPNAGEPCALGRMGPGLCAAGMACVEGTCGALPGDGDTCGFEATCAPGFGCAFEREQRGCRTLRAVGGACENDTICADGAHCDFSTGRCRQDMPLGATCTQGNECTDGATCVPDEGGTFVCVPIPAEGEACFFECAAGLSCTTRLDAFQCFPEYCGAAR